MIALRITVSTREVRLVDIAIPEPSRGEVRIKVQAAGVCLSDVHFVKGILSPGQLDGDEVTMGHEVAGIIDAIGADVKGFSLGDRVIICAGVRDEMNRMTTLGFDYDGGFAEFVIAKSSTLISIPDHLPFEQACIIPDAVSTPWAAITQTAGMKSGESAAVFGIGGLGVHAIALLRILGVTPIIAVDPMAEGRERALAAGASIALDPTDEEFKEKVKAATHNLGLNAAFDFAGVNSVRQQALPLLAEGGRLIIVGLANLPIVIPNDISFAYKRLQILGHYGSEPRHTQELVNLFAAGLLDLSQSVSVVLPLQDGLQALDQLENKIGNPIRIVLKP
jgi:D-arabinose 1-dehydrogenase-like Zn-dependent alcohol dehydrogenase